MKDSEILRRAQKLIKSGERIWICHAIENAVTGHVQQKTLLKRWIHIALEGGNFLQWLAA